jgi:hypothetical protein
MRFNVINSSRVSGNTAHNNGNKANHKIGKSANHFDYETKQYNTYIREIYLKLLIF